MMTEKFCEVDGAIAGRIDLSRVRELERELRILAAKYKLSVDFREVDYD